MSLYIDRINEKLFRLVDVQYLGAWEMEYDTLKAYLSLISLIKKQTGSSPKNFGTYNFSPYNVPVGLKLEEEHEKLLKEVKNAGLPFFLEYSGVKVCKNLEDFKYGIINPPSLSIEPISICNYRCSWCYGDSQNKPKTTRLDENSFFEQILKPGLKLGTLSWYIAGGEPNINPDHTLKILGHILTQTRKELGEMPIIALSTNGYNSAELMDAYFKNGVTTVQFSLSSRFPDKDAILRGVPKGVNSVEEVALGIIKAKKLGMRTVINCLIVPEHKDKPANVSDIPQMIRFAQQLGVDMLRFTPPVPVGAALVNKIYPTIKFMRQVSQLINEYAGKNKRQLRASCTVVINGIHHQASREQDTSIDFPVFCRAGTTFLYITANGDAYPCNNVIPDFCVDNTQRTPLDIIWKESKILNRWRQDNKACKECGICRVRFECVGMCRALCWARYRQLDLCQKPNTCEYEQQLDEGF
nr:hypothetical protein, radical SAM superfamily [uncultured archaeon]